MTVAVECQALAKTYRVGFFQRRVRALEPLDLSVNAGEVFGLIGPNGAGKSTAIKLLLNLVMPTSGSAKLFGVDVRDPASRRETGYVPENPVPYDHLTGAEYLALQAGLMGLSGAEASKEIDRVLERVEMKPHGHLSIRRYSKGMTQRVMLAGAILGKPKLVILDEPTSGLDPLGRRLVRDLILDLRRAGAAVLFCTHIMSDVETLCDRVALLIGGRIRRTGKVSELVTNQRTHEVVLEGATEEQVKAAIGDAALKTEATSQHVLLHVADAKLQDVLKAVLAANLRVARIAPERISLEDTFFEELKSAPQLVGGSLE